MNKNHNFENVFRICLSPNILKLLDNTQNLLYCSKIVTNILIEYYIKNKEIKLSTITKITKNKWENIKHILYDDDKSIKIFNLPPTLTHLTFDWYFNK